MEWVGVDQFWWWSSIARCYDAVTSSCTYTHFLTRVVTAGEGSKMADATTMLSICDPLHLVLIRTDTSSETTLVSSYFLDWRTVLSSPSGKTCFAAELMGVGKGGKVFLLQWMLEWLHSLNYKVVYFIIRSLCEEWIVVNVVNQQRGVVFTLPRTPNWHKTPKTLMQYWLGKILQYL